MSLRLMVLACVTTAMAIWSSAATASEIKGKYIETRTCQVYTGPCFANAEVGLAGKSAVMAWEIGAGTHEGVDLSGLKVVLALKSEKTLEFGGIETAGDLKSVVYVDQRANSSQQKALLSFAKKHAGRAGDAVVKVTSSPIDMDLDVGTLTGKVDVAEGKAVNLVTRKARPDDCICSNESAYYPPLVKVDNFVPGVAVVGEFKGRGLGTRWSTPGARSVYMGLFAY